MLTSHQLFYMIYLISGGSSVYISIAGIQHTLAPKMVPLEVQDDPEVLTAEEMSQS